MKKTAKGRLITFEGIDGCGKSTQAHLLYERLRKHGRECAIYREPGGTPLGENIRKILLNQSEKIDIVAEMLLFSAARAELIGQVIKPLLSKGRVILLDRFIDSTIAYQGYGRGINISLIESVNNVVVQGIEPDATFLLDIDPEDSMQRLRRAHDRMEQEGIAFMKKVRTGYLTLAESDSSRFHVLDGTGRIFDLAEDIWNRVAKFV